MLTDGGRGVGGAQGGWRRLRDWPVRRRLVALILVPTLVALGFGVFGVVGAVGNALGDRHTEALARLGGSLTAAAAQLEAEQTAAAAFAATGRPANGKGALRSAYRGVDDALTGELRRADLGVGGRYPAPVRARAGTAAFRIGELPSLRSTVEQSRLPVNVVIQKYTDIIADLLAVDDEIAAETADPGLLSSVRALGDISRLKLQVGIQRSLVGSALRAKGFELGGLAELNAAVSAQQSAYQQFQVAATGAEQQRYAYVVTGQDIDETQAMLNQVTSSDGRWIAGAPGNAAQTWAGAVSGTLDKVRVVERGLIGSVSDRAAELAGTAVRNAIIAGVVALAVLLVVLFATIMVARSLVRPLRSLRGGAMAVADQRLPALVARLYSDQPGDVAEHVAPIEVDSVDEVGQVARAFDEVHRVAARLAGEQAQLRNQINALFVSLSRRSQTLVERQLEVIDGLEKQEQDANRLRSLFRLDHLATRMRRNGENLLVLGGEEPSRRFTEAMPLLDVVRAAASEVERYERVEVEPGLPDVLISESAVTDVVHLLAELLDNATTFSPPDQPVQVRAYPADAQGGVAVEILDYGIGIAEDERAQRNADLVDPPVIQPGVSRHMGLFVVGRLAHKHGVDVRLVPGQQRGLIALAILPATLVTSRQPVPLTEPPSQAWPGQPAPGWPGQRWVQAMSATGAAAGSWFGDEPLPAIDHPSSASGEAGPRASASQHAWRAPTSRGRTSMGLPRREPGSNYVPGSMVGPSSEQVSRPGQAGHGEPTSRHEQRESWEQGPDALRNRFAAYQAGARRGHAEAHRAGSAQPVSRPLPVMGAPMNHPSAAGRTSMGLPRRDPGANYIPGSAGSDHVALNERARPRAQDRPSWEQSPEALRERFAALQSGSRRGYRAAAAPTTPPGLRRDEETGSS
ncbi:nitrate- and nitrite sensing domain-containing protein [Sciscionella marina]|uniref:sensor histidine kinase n=1 Tax=Sciscionella marina TaxID=508770 RepID=UPI00308440B5